MNHIEGKVDPARRVADTLVELIARRQWQR
jgi:hypothetical protein